MNQPIRDQEGLRGSLSKKLKSKRPKLNPGTPEKSEIFRLYEKLRQKRDQKVREETQDIVTTIVGL